MRNLRIIFFGTPDFAVGILDAIVRNHFEVVAVVTVADKPAGRGQQLRISAVKEYALSHNLPVMQPTNLRDQQFLSELKALNANLQVVVAFRMLPAAVWQMPTFGTFNLHASLLPDYRGAAPINWAIINGDQSTGVTTFFIDDKIDTGAMILSNNIEISITDTAKDLHDKLLVLGQQTVLQTLELIATNQVTTRLQNNNLATRTAHKLNRENCRIDWSKSGLEIYNQVRGLSPQPTAWTTIADKGCTWDVKIEQVGFEVALHGLDYGHIVLSKTELKVAVTDGFISLMQLQFPGKKKMNAAALLNGMRFSEEIKAI